MVFDVIMHDLWKRVIVEEMRENNKNNENVLGVHNVECEDTVVDECMICYEEKILKKILPCMHTICYECFSSIIKVKNYNFYRQQTF